MKIFWKRKPCKKKFHSFVHTKKKKNRKEIYKNFAIFTVTVPLVLPIGTKDSTTKFKRLHLSLQETRPEGPQIFIIVHFSCDWQLLHNAQLVHAKGKLTATHHAVVLTCISFLYTKTTNNCSSCLHSDLNNQNTEKMRNKQKHFNVTVANQFTVHKTSYWKENFSSKSEGENTEPTVFFPPTISPLSKNRGALLFDEERPIFEEQLWQ